MTRRLALITGASAGIGRALAREFASHGWDLALVARREDRLVALAAELEDTHGITTYVIAADLSLASAPDIILQRIGAEDRVVDALVNNAGYGLAGTYVKTSWEEQSNFLQLMLISCAELAHRVLPGMQARRQGWILNVASVAGLLPGSRGHTLYAAVKSALIKFSQSLHFENTHHNIKVTALCPGFTYSEFHDVNETRGLVSKLPKFMWMSAEEVATIGYEAMQRNQVICVPGTWNKFITGLTQILPAPVSHWLMERSSEKVRRSDTKPDSPAGEDAQA
ncbi:SDR family NAD(P)-dependent oxidoreductase [Maricaulis sp. CAU 1757]